MIVAIEALDPLHIRVWFRNVDLGIVEIMPSVNDVVYEAIDEGTRTKRRLKAA